MMHRTSARGTLALTGLAWLIIAGLAIASAAEEQTASADVPVATAGPPSAVRKTAPAVTATVSAPDGERVELLLQLPDGVQGETAKLLLHQDRRDAQSSGERLDLALTAGTLRIRGSRPALMAALAEGTRSLWVSLGTDEVLRVDLPGPEITSARMSAGDAKSGPALTLSITHLLPDFSLVYATQSTSAEEDSRSPRSAEAAVARRGLRLPKIESVSGATATSKITVRFAARPGDAADVRVFVSVINPDGSRSQTLQVTQQGTRFSQKATFVAEARPLPVDADVTVPDLELLEIAEAQKQARELGFIPIPCDMVSLQELPNVDDAHLMVLRQGLPAGTTSRLGEIVLLGVRPVDPNALDVLSATEASNRSAADPSLDPVGPTGFVPVPEAGGTIDGGLAAAGDNLLDDGAGSPVDDGSLGGNRPPDDLTDDSAVPPPEGSDDVPPIGPANDQPPPSNALIPIDPDPGINLDPTVTPEQNLLAGILQVVLKALVPMLGQGTMPGNLGGAISTAVQDGEAELVAAVTAAKPPGEWPVEKVFDTLAARLAVTVAPADRQVAIAACRAQVASRPQLHDLDENRNGLIADDIAVWFIVWLQKKGLFNPATAVQLADGGLNNTVAVISSQSVAPDWIAGLAVLDGLLCLNPGTSPGTGGNAGTNSNAAGTAAGNASGGATTITIPKGKSSITVTSHPSHVRVPDGLTGQLAREVVPKIRAVGLQPKTDGALISTDKVTQTQPEQGAWVRPSERVALKILRRVPKVTDQTAKDAESKLKEFELVARTNVDATIRPEDLVGTQKPAEGDYVERGASVSLTFQRRIPKVEGLTAKEAQSQLTAAGFRAAVLDNDDVLSTDVVIEQDPAWEDDGKPVFREPGTAVTFVRLGTRVPDLCGTNLTKAKTLAEAIDLLDARRLPYEVLAPATDFGLAKVVDQQPDAEALIDRTAGKVEFHLVVPVPEMSNRAPLNVVQEKLRERDLVPELAVEKAFPDDVVVSASVSGRVMTSGSVKFVTPGSKVQLDVGRIVPTLDGEAWPAALSELNRVGLQGRAASGQSPGSHVHHTSPPAGEVVEATEPVVLYPGVRLPDVEGRSLGDARELLQSLGLGVRTAVTTQEVSDSERWNQTRVTRQSPPANEIVARSTSTVVTLNAVRYTEDAATVPPLRGLAYQEAEEKAENAGVRIVTRTSATRITNRRSQHGLKTIDGQFTSAGTRVPKGTEVGVSVTQWIFREPQPEYVTVPQLVGNNAQEVYFTVEQAIGYAKRARLTPIVSYRGRQYDEGGWAGLAIGYALLTPPDVQRDLRAFRAPSIYQLQIRAQSPAAGTQVTPGTRVVVEVRIATTF